MNAPAEAAYEGVIDLDLDPTPSAPLPDFEAIAEKMISLGGHVVPVQTGQKACTMPNWQNAATRDLAVVAKWAAEDPHYNCAVVGKPDGLWLFDDDDNTLTEYESKHGRINTYRVRSVSGGTHLYFKQNDASRLMGNIGGKDEHNRETWSARVHNRYIISAGSVAHPDNDPEKPLALYRAENPSAAVTEAPADFIAFLMEKAGKNGGIAAADVPNGIATRPVVKIEKGGRNEYLFHKGCELRKAGAELPEIESALIRMNEELCEPPLGDDEVRSAATSASKYEYNDKTVLHDGRPVDVIAEEKKQPVDVSNWRSKFRNISEMEQGEPVMLIDGVLQEGTCFLGAAPSHGKTLVALAMAKALTLGTALFELPQYSVKKTYPVLYLIPETSDRPFRRRCEAFRLPTDDRFLVRTITEGASLKLTDPDLLEAVRQRHFVVILDTTRRFNQTTDSNSDAQNQILVTNVNDLRAAGAPCVVLLHHSTKAANSKKEVMTLENMLSGTGDFGAMCDQAYGLRRDDGLYNRGNGPLEIELVNLKDRERTMGLTELRLAATYLKTGEPRTRSWIDETGNFRPVDARQTIEQNTTRLVDLVKTNPDMTVTELVEATGIKTWTVKQTLKGLGWHHTKGGPNGSSPWHQDVDGKCPL